MVIVKNLFRFAIAPLLLVLLIIGLSYATATGFTFDRLFELSHYGRFHAPDLKPVLSSPAVIQIHLGAALAAFGLGLVQILAPKGSVPHRTLGWIWVGLMLVTAISSFFIRTINEGGLSFIHALSGWTVVIAPMIIYWARKHNIKAHKGAAIGLFMGGLVVAGLFTFVPGRLMWQVFFG